MLRCAWIYLCFTWTSITPGKSSNNCWGWTQNKMAAAEALCFRFVTSLFCLLSLKTFHTTGGVLISFASNYPQVCSVNILLNSQSCVYLLFFFILENVIWRMMNKCPSHHSPSIYGRQSETVLNIYEIYRQGLRLSIMEPCVFVQVWPV